ncbi:MAG: DnaJ domain-containing protein [Frankiaceae bacterium]|nr:DnaJ domain-containing protein [Frankiaceae bacterium]MBV9872500.1 DnaJ domain-containing protein [Frankiaceae bacterium]
MTINPYDVLGVPREASEAEIRHAYEEKLRTAQRHFAFKVAQQIDAAYSTLRDPRRRALFDRHGLAALPHRPSARPRSAFHEHSPASPSSIRRPQAPTRRPFAPVSRRATWLTAVALLIVAIGAATARDLQHRRHPTGVVAPASQSGRVDVICEPAPGAAGYSYTALSGQEVTCTNGATPTFDPVER